MKSFDRESYLKDLEALVNIDSGSDDPDGVKLVANALQKRFDVLNWVTELKSPDPSVGPCLFTKNRETESYDLLFLGHMDTVFPKGTVRTNPFRREGNRAYGPGVMDMKASLLLLVDVLSTTQLNQNLLSIGVFFNSDEEISSVHSSSLIRELAKKSKAVLVLEPARPSGAMIMERKGLKRMEIEFHGRAAHAGSNSKDGVHAILEKARWVIALQDLADQVKETTINVGIVEGGQKTNIIPDYARLELEVRSWGKEEFERIEEKVNMWSKNPNDPNVKIKTIWLGERPPMIRNSRSDLLRAYIDRQANLLGIHNDWIRAGGGSDANLTADLQVATLDGLGPSGACGHTLDEYLILDSLEPKWRLLRSIITDFQQFLNDLNRLES